MPNRRAFFLVALVGAASVDAQAPAGLAARAIATPDFKWRVDTVPGFRVYTLPGGYASSHRDSLIRQLPVALAAAQQMIGAAPLGAPIDVFFIDTRAQMAALTGAAATGFAHVPARAVFLVTNPTWRAFETHELMHVVAGNEWGHLPTRNPWLLEGLAQAADGFCAGYPNEAVAVALAGRAGWIDLPTLLHRFREQNDLRAYLQASALTAFLLKSVGPAALRELWRTDADTGTVIAGQTLSTWERRWRQTLTPAPIPSDVLAQIEAVGCGITSARRAPRGIDRGKRLPFE